MRKKLFTFLLALVTSVGLSWATEGALSGAFAINGDGDYIAFSKGNLQYHCTNHVWQFATNQYDIIGGDNANISDSYDGWVDLFGYGTGNNPTLTITNYSSFSTFTDWGVNAISNGGNEANLWRTLTRDEWAYLFNSRTNASSKYGMATVANVPGVIVLPDVYVGPAINTDHDAWDNKVISSSEWAAYEAAGAVFLPVAGYREGTTVDNLGSYGFYWSSTPYDAMFSKKLSLDQYLVEPEGYGLRYQGLSVRLVTETTPSSGSEPEPTEDAIVIVTKTKQSSYTQSTVTISCAAIGDSDGFSVSIYGDKTATITNSDASKIISKIELVPGYSESYHSYVRANGGTPASSSESLITFTNVNSNNVTLSITNEYIQIKEVRITLADNDDPTPDPTPAVDPAVQNVIDLINAIPNPVVYNQQCSNALNAVYDAYVALSEEQRDQVTNYNDYLDAESTYYMLGSVNYVIETINEIGNVEFTSACKHRIDYARNEYCNLTLEAKGYVTNYNTLLAAEAAYAALIPVSSTVEWDEAILETIDADEWGEATYTNGSISLKAVDGRAHYVDIDDHFIFDGMNSEKSFVFSCTSANMLCIEITVSEKHQDNELSCAWQETATGYRWVGEATSVDFASTIFKVTEIRFYLGEAFPEPTPTPAQDGDKLPGAFSVDGGKVVYFSKGNLQYLGNIDRWHFAENQWTIIGNAQASDNRDLFSWGTGDNPDSEDYSTYTEWGNNIEGNWRTLTVEEWTYLFNTRTGASSKYGTATVAGVVGLILLPDVYDGTAINTERTAWNNNVISGSEWAAYEAEGAVFLPAAGMSDADGVLYGVGEQGLYWSSTMDALSYQSIDVFYGFHPFDGYWFNDVNAQSQPQARLSVRLVSETAPTPAPTPVTSYVVEFALGDAEGTAPTTVDVTIGKDITMPVNKTMYKAGYTLTGWSDGVNTYPIGQPFTPANDVVLTPVFTANQADLLNASSDVTVKWYFGGDNGAPTTSYEGTSGLLVAQATIGDKTVDVKLAIDATSGKFVPEPTTEWAQVNVGTIFTYPYKAGMTVNVDNYKSNVTYYIADAEGKVTCCENDHYSFIEVKYPASASTTAVVIGDPNDASQVETFLTNYDGQTVPELTIDRPVKNNMYNTLCLPFHMDAGQIAASSLNGVEIYEFTDADVVNDELYLYTSEQKHEIVAGRPYLVKYSAASQLDDLDFVNVVVNNADLDAQKVVINGVTFKGTFAPYWMVAQGDLNLHGGYLFLGQNNTLYWPNVSNYIKPFRAYFYVNVNDAPAGMPMRRGMPAHIGGPAQIPTGVGQVSQEPRANSQKVMENGVLYIIKNDVKYNVQGQIVK